ncbi:mediator complex subunit [Lobosporangium transversale]|uniref:Mediator of RNA polymerase II transcription subunit 14 n=1 Tax=Lobosporangium transversale TaxID=64571 RepID=A0A1Y2GIS7_9FUNG|nr:mediator complex subunit MED14-domain-containing protein [Lobosporangium transversale]KAF9911460.1 mediator complex subunit [Lobosporangium transversale]ORZ10326.1 mediator complex subunit MED14-domain-containing protein [Lobosporangium transversale]|eukprot:XP_021879233.1 mediator complex subunit MED14-domain-containing protein [Lobosporangium transversale]
MAGTHSVHTVANGMPTDTSLTEAKMEPNGIVKGASQTNVASTSSASSSLVIATPVLPRNLAGMVPLGAIIHRMTNEAFSDLSNLSDILPSMTDAQKKLHILEYTLSKREQFIKLLVLTKWAKSAHKFQQCQDIVGFLRHENELFTRAVGGLFETYRMFGRARVRNFDIPTAIDVLTTGTYQRLPSRIKQVYVADEPPSRTEMAATLERLDDVIRMRLLCDELVPPAMKYTIGKGKVKFVVANEFQVTLTVSGPGSPMDVPWRIVGLEILVKPIGGSFQGLDTSLSELQMRAIIHAAQKAMDSSSPANATQYTVVPAGPESGAPANQALLRLYDYLHMVSLHLLIELVYIQAQYVRSGWNNRLLVDINKPQRSYVRLTYWGSGMTTATQTQTSAPAPKRRASASPSTLSGAQIQGLVSQQEHFLEIRIEEREGPKSEIPEGLAGALVDSKSLGYPKAYIKVIWSQVVKGVISEQEVGPILELDPSNIHVERLLLKTVNTHTGQVMQEFYDRLSRHIDATKTHPEQEDDTFFCKNDIKLDMLDSAEHSILNGVANLTGPKALLVRLKGDRWIRIRIDIRTGQVVVREVGKTGEGIDPVIAAFQNRLNENANNIVDALISLRFSMAMVELESLAVLLGLQPYRRIALGTPDVSKFGSNIQQILFLQYPQHPRYYLVIGVIDRKFCVWLIEVVPTTGILLTLKSKAPVYWQELKRQRKIVKGDVEPKSAIMKRKSVQFDVGDETPQEPSTSDGLTIDQDLLSKLEALCRAKICHTEVKSQLEQHGIQYRLLSSNTKGAEDASPARRPTNTIPLIRLEPSSISPGFTEGLFLYVGAKLTGWWDNQRETCNFIVQAKFAPDSIPSNMDNGSLDSSVCYHAKTGILSFTYKIRGDFIQQFKGDWEKIVRMLRIIRQLHAPTITSSYINLQVCHLHYVKLSYFGRYTATIRWAPPSIAERRSNSGVLLPNAPRFRQGLYEIDLAEIEEGVDYFINPHRRMKYFLQDMFNREADLHSLMNTIVQTCSILEVVDRLENSVKEDSMGLKLLSIIPRSAHHIRLVYGSKYALDIRAYSRTHLSMFDASFPSESFGSNLPPPPQPATAPSLMTPGRIVPPTSKGHLHYGAIPKLQALIGSIDVDKEDEEFNDLQPTIASLVINSSVTSSQGRKLSSHGTTLGGLQEEDSYEIMPLPNGLICSRKASGRALYRIAKHMESQL